ncbi:SDR family oxidoreductase [Steroidobacter agaridevorans]|uniref:SDR family oxidoreductase n=1 Tax=Steroidobacter agaridevorans TaxID=2695856 RepID=UPI0013263FBA|nr:SDR family NAD(P)-dependent oxidoreductase [Steroidobacter agaridevorans]GFE91896.1 acetoin dehydrogenase [Steroidobacter agaridevorans]
MDDGDVRIKAPMSDVTGKVAIVTGGDSGIGLGIARAFIHAGMNVAITYRSEKHAEDAMKVMGGAGDRVHAIALDVMDRAAFAAAAEEAKRVFGRVHVLVNNAGVWPKIALSNASYDDWDWCFGVNVTGVFNGIHAILPHIKSHGEGGHIVSTASIGGLVAHPLWGVYSASKFAVIGMMEALRSELVNCNIGVSVFCPGDVKSNIGQCDRNRPSALGERGEPDTAQMESINTFADAVRKAIFETRGVRFMMDPLEAGERVLGGIRNNDLHILSHPEYEQAIRDRNDALLAAVPRGAEVHPARVAIASIARNPIYLEQIAHRHNQGTRVV